MEIVIVSIVMLVGVVYGYYTVSGSGIAEHPHGKIYSGAPGRSDRQRLRARRDRLDEKLVARHALAPPGQKTQRTRLAPRVAT